MLSLIVYYCKTRCRSSQKEKTMPIFPTTFFNVSISPTAGSVVCICSASWAVGSALSVRKVWLKKLEECDTPPLNNHRGHDTHEVNWPPTTTHLHTDTEANMRELIKEIRDMSQWKSGPRLCQTTPLMVCLPLQHSPCSDLIRPINIIQYACEHKHCSQYPSSSGQNALDLQFIALLTRFPLHSQNSCFSFKCWTFFVRLFVCDTMAFIVMNAQHLGLSDMIGVNPLPHRIYSGVYWCPTIMLSKQTVKMMIKSNCMSVHACLCVYVSVCMWLKIKQCGSQRKPTHSKVIQLFLSP